jgi:peptide-methionine (S)-S-oxide reductase
MKLAHLLIPLSLLAAGPATAAPRTETAVLAGGCFWGMEAVFEHVKGVKDVVSGYAGGSAKDAHYDAADSGHAEAVRITYDPAQVTYARLLQVFFAVAHNPTEVNRQGPDVGPSYRSAIFPQNGIQATKIESGGFYPAEAYHQDFARKNPYHPYILINDKPKVTALKRQYPNLFKA